MSILTHGSDLTLAPTLGPLARASGMAVPGLLKKLVAAGFRSVQLDATLSGLRPRDLDRRARRDLSATLIRKGLGLAGIDLFIPRMHYLSAEHADRAVSATLAGIELAADLGRATLSIALPAAEVDGQIKQALIDAADGRGIRLAVHAEDQLGDLVEWVTGQDLPEIGLAVDPAATLSHGEDPALLMQQHGRHVTVARLSDFESGEQTRCPAGRGGLDLMAYRVGCDLATARKGPLVLDLRGLTDPVSSAAIGKANWDDTAPEV